ILNRMQKDGTVRVKIYDRDFDDLTEVDTKIVRLARILEAKVVTNDFNLNKVAELYGVPVLNINELANAIKPVVLPGEEMQVHIIKDGKEFGQGIGYLEDGTMVVVDGGRPYIGVDLEVRVSSVLQTSAGRMIFGKPKELARSAMAQIQ
ncbi:MAG: TRAM domain-containing protein, partial [Methanobacteriota archaeon]